MKIRFVCITMLFLIQTHIGWGQAQTAETNPSPPAINNSLSLKKAVMPVGLTIGAAFRPDLAFAHKNAAFSENYRKLYLNQVDQITDDWAMKMEEIWTAPDEFNFTYADKTVAFAHANGLKVRGHTLVWELLVPTWMKKGMKKKQFADAQIEKLVQTYVHKVVRHFKDKFPGTVVCWDVINEPVEDDGKSLRKEFWFKHLGENYLEKVLRWAHEADPDALLFINEFGIEEPGPKQDYFFELVQTLKRKEVPLHGIGFQCHFSIREDFREKNLEQALDRFIGAGFVVQVTELDVRINDDKKGITPEKLETQARIFREVTEICIERYPKCSSLTIWGLTDEANYIANAKEQKKDWPFLYSETLAPKPAFSAMLRALSRSTEELGARGIPTKVEQEHAADADNPRR